MSEYVRGNTGRKQKIQPIYRLRLSYEETMDRLRETYADTPAGYHDGCARQEAQARIEKCREECRLMEGGMVETQTFPEQPFAGRKRELQLIRDKLAAGSRIILISGMGGIGKTALMTAFARQATAPGSPGGGDYDRVLYLPAGEGISKAVTDDTALTIYGMSWSSRRYRSRQKYFRDKLETLKRLAEKERLLILVDNIKDVRVRSLADLLRVPADFLISSRLTAQAFEGLPKTLRPVQLLLTEMPDEELEELAELLNPGLDAEKMDQYRALCRRMQGHTLALKLWLVSDGMLSEYSSGGELIFSVHDLGRRARLLLMALSVLPAEGVPRWWIQQMCEIEPELTDQLIARSLIQQQTGSDGKQWLSLHPLIAENVRRMLKPDLKNCRHFLEHMAEDVGNAWNEPRTEMLKRLPSVHSVLAVFPQCPVWMTNVMDRFFTYLWVMEDFRGAERGYLKLYKNIKNTYGQPAQETGWIALRAGAVYHNSMHFDEAERWYERGLYNLRNCQPANTDYWWIRMEACGKCMRGPLFRGETDKVMMLMEEAEAVYAEAPEEARSDRLLLTEAYHSRRRASLFLHLGQTKKAQEYRRRMHEEMEQYFARCGVDGPRVLDLRETDIEFELAAGNLGRIIHLLEENIEGYEYYRGPEHEDTLRCMEQLAEVLTRLKRQGSEEECKYRARELYMKVAAGLRTQYPFETVWLARVEEKIRGF